MNMTFNDIEPIIREKIAMGADVTIQPNGTSMLPLIVQGEDEVVLCRKEGKLKKYDIPFYKRKNGQFVLHRIVKVRKNDYVLCGDNQTNREYGVTDDMVIAVVKEIRKKDRIIDVNDPDYLLYSKNIVKSQIKKRTVLKIKNIIKKIIFWDKIKGRKD